MIFCKEDASSIAKERLKLMMESESLEYSTNDISRLKKEISALVSRYFDMSTDMFEVRIALKPKDKQ